MRDYIQLFINSENRSSGSATNFKTRLNRGINNIESIKIRSVEIPNSFYPVNSNNNTIQFQDNVPNTYSVTLTPGSYTSSELLTELETQMSSALAGFTGGSFDDNTLKFTLSNGTNDFKILDSTTTTAQKLIGLSGDTALGSSWTSDNAVNITGPSFLFIMSNKLSTGRRLSYSDNTERPIFLKVPINCNFSEVIMANESFHHEETHLIYDNQFNMSEIDFQLVDDEYNELDLNGLNWSIEFLIRTKLT